MIEIIIETLIFVGIVYFIFSQPKIKEQLKKKFRQLKEKIDG